MRLLYVWSVLKRTKKLYTTRDAPRIRIDTYVKISRIGILADNLQCACITTLADKNSRIVIRWPALLRWDCDVFFTDATDCKRLSLFGEDVNLHWIYGRYTDRPTQLVS